MATVVRDPAALRAATGEDAGLVPTMGALHEGHLALIRRSAAENARTAVSIFVNPTQFSNPADLDRYPRDFDRDIALASAAGADVIYAPPAEIVYPPGFATSVEVAGLTDRWEGEFRPGHFRGVATVVTILLSSARPAHAYFGEKDYQQLVVVRRLHRDLALPGAIVGCPTVRDEDGLALSSRNARLTPSQRQTATAIPRALFAMVKQAAAEQSVDRLIALGQHALETPWLTVDYLAVVDPETLEPLATVRPGARVLIAATVGAVRLIDNLAL